jgi:inosine-uridine nucleoside N-ribohydrolase
VADKAPVIGAFLKQAAQFYFGWHRGKGVHDGCFLHDPCAVLAAAEPHLFEARAVPLRVVTGGEQAGRTVADANAGTLPVRVCTAVDAEALRERFLSVLATADICRAGRA